MIVDESHLMSDDVLEGIRLLNNLEEGAAKLLQIILLGQQELSARLSAEALERCFDPARFVKNLDRVFERVFDE